MRLVRELSSSVEKASVMDMLPDDLVVHICSIGFMHDLVAASASATTCQRLNRVLQPLLSLTRAERSLVWNRDETIGHVVTGNGGRTLTRLGGRWTKSWAAMGLLPTAGRMRWRVRIDRCAANEGVMCIGVCDRDAKHAYGLAPFSGQLSCLSRKKNGDTIIANECAPPQHSACTFTKRLMDGDLRGRAHGAIVEITVDADRGTVHIRVNRGEAVCAIAGLEPGVQLRPWARLFDVGDRISTSGYWTPC